MTLKDLSNVHAPRWNLHVMAKFEVGQEGESMDSADSSIDLEDQVCNGFSWKDVTNDELRYYVVSGLL